MTCRKSVNTFCHLVAKSLENTGGKGFWQRGISGHHKDDFELTELK